MLGKGQVPCDILFVGEAPGRSEDALGKPFVGPAGDIMDEIVEEALRTSGMVDEQADCLGAPDPWTLRVAFTNLICCIPLNEEEDGKLEEPPPESVAACAPRLAEFVSQVAKPKLLVRVGKHAREYLTPGYHHSVNVRHGCDFVDIAHPGSMLVGRVNAMVSQQLRRRAAIILRDAIEEVFGCPR